MKISIPKEIHHGELRVAATPDVVSELQKLGYSVYVEAGAGEGASFGDEAYRAAGAEVIADPRRLCPRGDIVLKVRPPERHTGLAIDEVDLLHSGQTLVCFLWPAQNPQMLKRLAQKGVTTLAMDSVPRISRAQKMDAL